jgi:hypothetical protein
LAILPNGLGCSTRNGAGECGLTATQGLKLLTGERPESSAKYYGDSKRKQQQAILIKLSEHKIIDWIREKHMNTFWV